MSKAKPATQHKQCFQCNTIIGESEAIQHDNKDYCSLCYLELFSP